MGNSPSSCIVRPDSPRVRANANPLTNANLLTHAHKPPQVKFGGLASSLGLLAICSGLGDRNREDKGSTSPLPWWIFLFAPGPWLMAVREAGSLRGLPAPWGVLLSGGSFNIAFFMWYTATAVRAFVLHTRNRVSSEVLARARTAAGPASRTRRAMGRATTRESTRAHTD